MRYRTIVVARDWTADGGTSKRGIGEATATMPPHTTDRWNYCRLRTKSDVQRGNHHRPTCPPPRRVLRKYVELLGDTRWAAMTLIRRKLLATCLLGLSALFSSSSSVVNLNGWVWVEKNVQVEVSAQQRMNRYIYPSGDRNPLLIGLKLLVWRGIVAPSTWLINLRHWPSSNVQVDVSAHSGCTGINSRRAIETRCWLV